MRLFAQKPTTEKKSTENIWEYATFESELWALHKVIIFHLKSWKSLTITFSYLPYLRSIFLYSIIILIFSNFGMPGFWPFLYVKSKYNYPFKKQSCDSFPSYCTFPWEYTCVYIIHIVFGCGYHFQELAFTTGWSEPSLLPQLIFSCNLQPFTRTH